MPRAKPLNEGEPAGVRPVFGEHSARTTCHLCGDEINRGDVVQAMMPAELNGEVVRAHLKCFREHQLFVRAMSAPKD